MQPESFYLACKWKKYMSLKSNKYRRMFIEIWRLFFERINSLGSRGTMLSQSPPSHSHLIVLQAHSGLQSKFNDTCSTQRSAQTFSLERDILIRSTRPANGYRRIFNADLVLSAECLSALVHEAEKSWINMKIYSNFWTLSCYIMYYETKW